MNIAAALPKPLHTRLFLSMLQREQGTGNGERGTGKPTLKSVGLKKKMFFETLGARKTSFF